MDLKEEIRDYFYNKMSTIEADIDNVIAIAEKHQSLQLRENAVSTSLPLITIDEDILQTCIDMYNTGERLTAIKWLIEEAKQDKYTFGIKWAKEYFENLGLDAVGS